MNNEYKIHKQYAEIIINSPKFGIFYIKIDLDDVENCKKYKWCINAYRNKHKSNKIFYYASNYKTGFLHRFLTDCPKGIQIDHINQDTLDCRKNNLRKATHSQQRMNGDVPVNNTSGRVGVTWDKSRNKWIAFIEKNKFKKNLGYYDVFDEAVRAREKSEIEYFGEFCSKKY